MTDILLTNDDGYQAIGFYPLLKELSKEFSVTVVAPEKQRSWVGKSITSRIDLNLKKVKLHEFEIYTLDGTPADCVQVGLYNVLKVKPKLVISGINDDTNTGYARLLSSGTVGAAIEAALDGVFAIAFSICPPEDLRKSKDFLNANGLTAFSDAAKIALKITGIIMKGELDKDIDLLSVNIPYGATIDSGFEVTRLSRETYGQLFHKKENVLTHKTTKLDLNASHKGTDLRAIVEGRISITPLNLDLSLGTSIDKLSKSIKENW